MQIKKFFLLVFAVCYLSACSSPLVKSGDSYQLMDRTKLYQLEQWAFEGRLALSDGQESWSAAIDWQHRQNQDRLKLSGPLGQGAVEITLSDKLVIIDKGDGKIEQSTQIDEFIQQQAGIMVPVRSLRYWVLGLTNPAKQMSEMKNGFAQEDWLIQFLEMQQAGADLMPHKIRAEKDQLKLKLIIDNWIF